MSSLRERLRHDGRTAHDRVDEAFAGFDLTQPEGLQGFLQAHALALLAIAPEENQESGSGAGADPAYLHQLIREDLATLSSALGSRSGDPEMPDLGAAKSTAQRTHPAGYHPVSIDYVLLGSRLGMQVLRRRWQLSEDAAVRQASGYISLPSVSGEWRALCSRLAAQPSEGPEADRIVTDALYIFEVFENAAKSARASFSRDKDFSGDKDP